MEQQNTINVIKRCVYSNVSNISMKHLLIETEQKLFATHICMAEIAVE